MEPAAAALMVLLSCSPEAADCREMRAAETFGSIAECREMLPTVLKRLDRADRPVIGRCTLAADAAPRMDRMVTGSIGAQERGMATVQVTSFEEGRLDTRTYEVQRAP